eukprot:626807-Amphidinium_carterae.1
MEEELQAYVPGLLPSDSASAKAAREDVRGLPGADCSASEGEGGEGGQDAQDRAAEGFLGAKTVGRYKPPYSPSDDKKRIGATRQPTGSDRYWKDKLVIQASRHNTDVFEAKTSVYKCPLCSMGTPISQFMCDHLAEVHKVGLEPNRLNEYSVGEVVSGINNLAMGRKFCFDAHTERPKFEFIGVKNKIN